MTCPECGAATAAVTKTRHDGTTVVRNRKCPECGALWRTAETVTEVTRKATNSPGATNSREATNSRAIYLDLLKTKKTLNLKTKKHLNLKNSEATNSRVATNGPATNGPSEATNSPTHGDLFVAARDAFTAAWSTRYGRPYQPLPGDYKHLTAYLRTAPALDGWRGLVERYVAYGDHKFREITSGHSLRWLVTRGVNLFAGPASTPSRYRDL